MEPAVDSATLDLIGLHEQLKLEDTIIFYLFERLQFPLSACIYDADTMPVPSTSLALPPRLSLCDYVLCEIERLHSSLGRYDSPDEYPFFPQILQRPILRVPIRRSALHDNHINVNDTIKEIYIKKILPLAYRRAGRDPPEEAVLVSTCGSAATCDVACLQAMSRRVHIAKLLAECLFQQAPEEIVQLIKANDRGGIEALLTNMPAHDEQKVRERLCLKADAYVFHIRPNGMEKSSAQKLDLECVLQVYDQIVHPLAKLVAVEYLMQRLKRI